MRRRLLFGLYTISHSIASFFQHSMRVALFVCVCVCVYFLWIKEAKLERWSLWQHPILSPPNLAQSLHPPPLCLDALFCPSGDVYCCPEFKSPLSSCTAWPPVPSDSLFAFAIWLFLSHQPPIFFHSANIFHHSLWFSAAPHPSSVWLDIIVVLSSHNIKGKQAGEGFIFLRVPGW